MSSIARSETAKSRSTRRTSINDGGKGALRMRWRSWLHLLTVLRHY
jgi:hypothetical protein